MAKAIYLDSVAGVAGDMFTAAFVDAGLVTIEELNSLSASLGLDGVRIKAEKVVRASVIATHITVEAHSDEWKHRFSKGHSHDHSDNGHRHDNTDETTNLLLDNTDDHWHVHYGEIDAF